MAGEFFQEGMKRQKREHGRFDDVDPYLNPEMSTRSYDAYLERQEIEAANPDRKRARLMQEAAWEEDESLRAQLEASFQDEARRKAYGVDRGFGFF